jgi:hypothetical protein
MHPPACLPRPLRAPRSAAGGREDGAAARSLIGPFVARVFVCLLVCLIVCLLERAGTGGVGREGRGETVRLLRGALGRQVGVRAKRNAGRTPAASAPGPLLIPTASAPGPLLIPTASAPGPLPLLYLLAHPGRICTGTWAPRCHICGGTWARPLSDLHLDLACPCHIRSRTELTLTTSAPPVPCAHRQPTDGIHSQHRRGAGAVHRRADGADLSRPHVGGGAAAATKAWSGWHGLPSLWQCYNDS